MQCFKQFGIGSRWLVLLLSVFSLTQIHTVVAAEPARQSSNPIAERPETWAARIDNSGLKNFYAVSTNFYRGAQPSKEGMAELQKLGVKTVVNLRGFHSDRRKIGKLELASERFHFNTWHAEDEDVIGFLKIVTDTNRWPVFVHCMHGSDRTGLMCAMYRMTVCDWTREEAIREMTEGGYGYHPQWKNLVSYLRAVDIDRIKRAAGIPVSSKKAPVPK